MASQRIEWASSRDGQGVKARSSSSRRGRKPGSITVNACVTCKAARAKVGNPWGHRETPVSVVKLIDNGFFVEGRLESFLQADRMT